ncbi:MAG TPA: hypothetical protein VHF28_06745 [Nitrososphaera sp.]|jgi:hypothetical protein|nr:hypothetical protein [Nitrososphaera sp.]
MSENNEGRFYRGSAKWVIVGIIAAVVIIFGVILAFGSSLFPSGGQGIETASETADESATSGPGHNTTADGSVPAEGPEQVVSNATDAPGAGQIPDSEITFGRETSTVETPSTAQFANNITRNGTNGGLSNPLGENITSLTGT